jgi:SRSO17 transposase
VIFSGAMTIMDSAAVARLKRFFGDVGVLLGSDSRRASFATYALGLLSEGERKSVEPMSAKACPDVGTADAAHQRLLHFVGNGKWSDRDIRRFAAVHALGAMTACEKIESWVIDDTGFLKQGKHSVGVQRQYTGSAGKITNCQIGVSLSVTTRTEHVPIDFELYLPTCWTDDPGRRKEARIPEGVVFKTKPELAIDMVRRAVEDGVTPGVVLADSAYGSSSDFRLELRRLNLHYAVGVDPKTTVFETDPEVLQRGGAAISVRDLAVKLMAKKKFRRTTWRKGTKEDLTARFAMRRVFPCRELGRDQHEREPVWLLVEWRDGEKEPANYFFSSLPKTTRRKPLVRLVMQRWRTERIYEDLKGELGLDHYEGRRFQGWHHHVSVVLCCYAFVVSERVQRFPPSARRTIEGSSYPLAA